MSTIQGFRYVEMMETFSIVCYIVGVRCSGVSIKVGFHCMNNGFGSDPIHNKFQKYHSQGLSLQRY